MIAGSNFTLMYTGLMMDKLNDSNQEPVEWSPFILGCVLGVFPWITILIYLIGNGDADKLDRIPNFVYGIVASYFIFYQSFAVNMFLYYKRIGKWKSFVYTEKTYQVLSLVSKSLLAWLVFGGLNQPNEYN